MRREWISRLLILALCVSLFAGGAVFAEDEDPGQEAPAGSFEITKKDSSTGLFKIKGKVTAPSSAAGVEYEVWARADQSDRRVYEAKGSETVTVDVADHKHHFGTYRVRMYVKTEDGGRTSVAFDKFRFKPRNYIYAKPANRAKTKYVVRILNPRKGLRRPGKVVMAAWSKKKGQTDRHDYRAKKYHKKYNYWKATINTKKHTFAGVYYTKVLFNGKKSLGTVSFKAKRPLSAVEKRAEKRLNKTGRSLRAAFRWSVHMPYRSVNTRQIRQCDKMANYGFKNHCGNCGVMAATFYQMARRLGYYAHYVCGYVPLAGGGMGPHAWVEIRQGGRNWVYDPDFQHETGRNGFKIYYGYGGTWRYSSYSRVN